MPRSKAQEENLLAELLEDLSKLSGVDMGEILSDSMSEESEDEGEFREFEIHEEPHEGEEFDIDSEAGDFSDYLYELFDDLDVDMDDSDAYGDEQV